MAAMKVFTRLFQRARGANTEDGDPSPSAESTPPARSPAAAPEPVVPPPLPPRMPVAATPAATPADNRVPPRAAPPAASPAAPQPPPQPKARVTTRSGGVASAGKRTRTRSSALAVPAGSRSNAGDAASDDELAASIDKAVDDLRSPVTAPPPSPGRHTGKNEDSAEPERQDRRIVHGASTAQDLEAVRATYAALSAEYCAPIRNVMIELRSGEIPAFSFELVRSSLVSFRRMAAQVEIGDLVVMLDRFVAAVTDAVGSGQVVGGERRQALLDGYASLAVCLPSAFDLEAETAQREPIILQSLLLLVPGVVPLTVERFLSAGLTRVDALIRAQPAEVAAVTGLDLSLVAQVLELLRAEGSIGTADPDHERKRLQVLSAKLGDEHAQFERTAAEWTAQARAEKRRLRQVRELTWLRIRVSLARLGELQRLARLERLPFGRKIEELQGFLRAAPPEGSADARSAKRTTVNGGEPQPRQGI